jgi:hypothetical protein
MENETAIDWILKEINERGGFIFTIHYEEVFAQAKQMEKQQIIKFANKVLDNVVGRDIELIKPIEEIYNETYLK